MLNVFRRKPAEIKTPEIIVPVEQIQDTERFLGELEHRYQMAFRSLKDDEQVAVFYQSGQVLVRVSAIQMLPAQGLLVLTGTDECGRPFVVSSFYKSMHVDFRKVKLGELEVRSTVHFSVLAG